MKKVWVISDTHFGHTMLKEKYDRPSNYEEQILQALWAFVKPGDLLIHLGDFCIGGDMEWTDKYWHASRGKEVTRILVRGNHDDHSNSWYRDHGFDFVCRSFTDKYYGKSVIFTHQPLNGMDLEEADSINVHGHTHGNNHRGSSHHTPQHREVACETLGYCPVELKDLLDKHETS